MLDQRKRTRGGFVKGTPTAARPGGLARDFFRERSSLRLAMEKTKANV